MHKIETNKKKLINLAAMLILGAVLAACAPTPAEQEIPPAVTQTNIPSETQVVSPTPEVSATPENTPTVTATATPEVTPTTQIPEWPSDINFENFRQFTAGELGFSKWAENYITKDFQVIIRNQDLHLEEPFTMLNGRYYVQAWADGWLQEPDGTQHHFSLPVIVWDTEKYILWAMRTPYLHDFPDASANAKEALMKAYTSLVNESPQAQWLIDEMCLTDSGDRDCGDGRDLSPYYPTIGWVPNETINGQNYKTDMEPQINFWRDLIEGVYTKENVEAFWQTFDPDLLSLNQDNLPEDFLIPARVD